jgi:signal transduction histidine kinase
VALAALGGILLVALAGWLVARSFTRRLADLSGAAARIAGGKEGGRVREEGGDELARFAGAFNRMVDALAESRDRLVHAERMAALGKLASSVAHEIRNPLASIRMTADLLRADLPGGEPREALDMLLREIRRLELFVEEILSLSGKIAVKQAPADPAEAAAETAALLKDRLAHLGVSVKNGIEPGRTHPMDADRVRQVLLNLVLNGSQAAGAGSEVRIGAVWGEDGSLRIEVRDPGPGVRPEDEARLFEPFFTTREGGTGLGLAVCRRIAEAHGGRMRYRREGGWTVFSLELPPAAPGAGS